MRRFLCVLPLLAMYGVPVLAQQSEEATIRASLDKQSMDTFCRKTLREAVRTPTAKQKPAFLGAVKSIAFHSYGVDSSEIEDIQKKQFRIGTSECALVAALGRPEKTNRSVNAGGYTMQWVYRDRGMYIYTSAGKVTSWQE